MHVSLHMVIFFNGFSIAGHEELGLDLAFVSCFKEE